MDELVDYVIEVDNDDDLYNKYKKYRLFNSQKYWQKISKKLNVKVGKALPKLQEV